MEDNLEKSNLPGIITSNLKNKCSRQKNTGFNETQRGGGVKKLQSYFLNSYNLENQALCNSFGKMILSKSESSPRFSFGKEKRFYQDFNKNENEFYSKLFDKIKTKKKGILANKTIRRRNYKNKNQYLDKIKILNLSSDMKCPSEFLYFLPPTNVYKYPLLPKFSFGKSLRDLQKPIKNYDFYKLSYDKKTDMENVDKKWRKRIVGGDIGIESRFKEDKKLFLDSITPGPGKYNPDYDYFKYKRNKYGYMGIKLKEDKNSIITDRPKKISSKAYNIKKLLGIKDFNKLNDINNYRSNSFLKDKNIKENNKNHMHKIRCRNIKYLFKEKLSPINNSKINLSFNNKNISNISNIEFSFV